MREGRWKETGLDRGAVRTYVSVDGGMSDNIRTALYDAEYSVVLASRESAAEPVLSRVVGKHCESGDIVVRDAWLPGDLAPGDLLAVAATGAYCRSMASNYNSVPRPAVVSVRDGSASVVLRRETPEDLLALDAGLTPIVATNGRSTVIRALTSRSLTASGGVDDGTVDVADSDEAMEAAVGVASGGGPWRRSGFSWSMPMRRFARRPTASSNFAMVMVSSSSCSAHSRMFLKMGTREMTCLSTFPFH